MVAKGYEDHVLNMEKYEQGEEKQKQTVLEICSMIEER